MEPNIDSQQAVATTTKSKKGLVVIIVLLLSVLAAVGYFLYKENNDHSSTIQQLTNQTIIVNDNAQVIRDAKLEPSFRKLLQERANDSCSVSRSAVLFNTTTSLEKNGDGSIKKYFAVSQFICSNGDSALTGPIRFSAAQSYDGIDWTFTYGSSTSQPTSLPNYIFDTDPALYNRKYNNPQHF